MVRNKLVEQRRAQQTSTTQTHQAQPQPQIEPLPEPQQTLQPQPEPQPQPQSTQPEQPAQAQPISVATGLVSFQPHGPSSEALNHIHRSTGLPSPEYPNSNVFKTWQRCTSVLWQRTRYRLSPVESTRALSFLWRLIRRGPGTLFRSRTSARVRSNHRRRVLISGFGRLWKCLGCVDSYY